VLNSVEGVKYEEAETVAVVSRDPSGLCCSADLQPLNAWSVPGQSTIERVRGLRHIFGVSHIRVL
jgi:hypothetical protein